MKMESFLKLTLGIVLVLTTGCTSEPAAENVLVVGTNAAYPPYESVNEKGEIVGFDIDVAHAIAMKMGKKLVVHNMAFDALILALKQKKFDLIISGISITSSREKEIALVPYQGEPITGLTLLFAQKPPEDIKALSDVTRFGNKTVAVQVGTFMESYLSKVVGVVPKALESNVEMILDLTHGKSVAALIEPHIADELLTKNKKLIRVDFPLPQEEWVLGNGIGIRKGNDDLLRDVKNAVAELKEDGSMQKFAARWFSGKIL